MPKISVIVPIYNAESYVERCLNSIVSQSFDDIEIILVDDGSTDKSLDICQKFATKDARIKVVSQKNSGPDIARKNGLHASCGEYISFVDADDYLAAGALNTMYEALVANEADLVCSQIKRFNDEGKEWTEGARSDSFVIYKGEEAVLKAYFEDRTLPGTYYAKLIHRDILKDYPFVENSIIGEDISAALYMYRYASKVVVIPDVCYCYYWNGNSISHSGYTDRHYSSLLNYIKVRDELLERDCVSEEIICGYFAGFQMAVATAMSRNWMYNKTAAELLKSDIKKHWDKIARDKQTRIYMKTCMLIYMISPKLFMFLYRIIYLITGR